MTDSVLLIHDDSTELRTLGARFEAVGFEVLRELDGASGVGTLSRIHPDVVCVAAHVADASPSLIGQLGEREAPVVVFAPAVSSDSGARAMAAGAARIVEHAADPEALVSVARLAAAEGRRRRVASHLFRAGSPRHGADSLGNSPSMRQLATQLGLLAQSERTTLLIAGEAGVGKAWAGRVIHDLGARAGRPFLEVRLGAQDPAHLESTIFGHERGALANAAERHRGLLELADGGTLLLREVGELPAELQTKVLRVLETRSFRRLGGTQDIATDTRLMVTTRRQLGEEVAAERFGKDLYYRLSVMSLDLPPLRDRSSDDRAGLVSAIHGDLQGRYREGPAVISPEAQGRLLEYGWPGNIREMETVLERAMIIARGQVLIGVEHLPGEFRARPGIGDRRHTPMSIEDLERQHIERTLRYHGGNRTRASKELGISRATLINKIKLYNLTD